MSGNQAIWLFTGAATLFLVGTDVFIMSPLLPAISAEFGVTPAAAGWLVTVMAVMYACGSPWAGTLFDRLQERRSYVLVAGLVCFALANLGTALADSFLLLLGSRLAAGLSLAAIAPSVYAFVSGLAPANRRAAWLSVVVSGNLTGLWVGTPLGTLLAGWEGWRLPFLCIAAGSLLLALLNGRVWPKMRKNTLTPLTKRRPLRDVLRSVIVTILWSMAMYGVYTFLGTALAQQNEFTSAQLAVSLTAYGVGAMLGSLSGGRLADWLGERPVSTASLLVLVPFLSLVGTLPSSNWLYPLLFLWAFVGYAFVPSYQSRLSNDYPGETGRIMSWNITGMYIGMTLGSYLGGPVYQLWGFSALALICGGFALGAGVLSLGVVGRQVKSVPPDHL
ncbi:MFS transporter [Brevibacillus borstelensis]|uniref:MFS transporter n=1 Tax=Brevibacillus borstelensis TaxID=45462 RepID=UPI00203FD8A7|nr:MFS transporter [Brevibacillus borstelensis]MCM3623808.1 MFS transporter [Brevibacillus borstelensis]